MSKHLLSYKQRIRAYVDIKLLGITIKILKRVGTFNYLHKQLKSYEKSDLKEMSFKSLESTKNLQKHIIWATTTYRITGKQP